MPPFSQPTKQDLLAVYLNDHLTGASAGVDLFARVAATHSDPDTRQTLRQLADEVSEDRDVLLVVMRDLGVTPRAYRILAGRIAEKLGRVKMNGTLLTRSPLTDLVELEALRIGVNGKLAMWQALAIVAESDDRLAQDRMTELIRRAESQLEQIESLRREAVSEIRRPTAR